MRRQLHLLGRVGQVGDGPLGVAVDQLVAGLGELVHRLGGGVRVLDGLLQVGQQGAALLGLVGQGFHVLQGAGDGGDILVGQQFVDPVQRFHGALQHRAAAGQQVRQRTPVAVDQGHLAVRRHRLQQRLGHRAAGDLDIVDPGDALGLEHGVGVDPHRNARLHAGPGDHQVRIVGREGDLADLADLDAVEVNLAADRQAADRAFEHHVIDVVLLGEVEAREPDHEGHQADEKPERDDAHQGVVGVPFHQPRPRLAPAFAVAARPRGPRKYSRIQGWSDFSISCGVPVATTFLSAITAIRSQIA